MWISETGMTAVAHADAGLTFSNRRELLQLATNAFQRGARRVVVDLSETEHVDRAALSMLAMLAYRIRFHGGAFCLTNVNTDLRAMLVERHLDRILLAETADEIPDNRLDGTLDGTPAN